MRHVITLSTIPPRFGSLGPTLLSLRAQSSRPEAIEVYIPKGYRRFPDWGGGLPEVPEGVRIVRSDEDHGPATKILPAAQAYRGQEVELLYVDDDHVYGRDWAAKSLALRKAHPEAVICAGATTVDRLGVRWKAKEPLPRAVLAPPHALQLGFQLRLALFRLRGGKVTARALFPRFRKVESSGYADIAEGYAGVGIRPDFLDDAAYAIPAVVWAVDDVWLSGHYARRGIPVWADRELNLARAVLQSSRAEALNRAVIDGAGRDAANRACIDHMRRTYGIWGGVATQST
ncbi:glycosyltransferase family A protein [Tabrizicola thermarum]|uniref:glycosyltransferase family A protein n=1 Tax=Tabrizicola thermarum TaxID=2670345 RepID=UPI000FFBE382|nr:glycosyltransferase family A protein [Tabrizicola thermarum]